MGWPALKALVVKQRAGPMCQARRCWRFSLIEIGGQAAWVARQSGGRPLPCLGDARFLFRELGSLHRPPRWDEDLHDAPSCQPIVHHGRGRFQSGADDDCSHCSRCQGRRCFRFRQTDPTGIPSARDGDEGGRVHLGDPGGRAGRAHPSAGTGRWQLRRTPACQKKGA